MIKSGVRWLIWGLILFAFLSCGSATKAPYGSTVKMPEDQTITSDTDVVVHLDCVVLNEEEEPLSDIDVDFYIMGGVFIDENGNELGTEITLRTDERGIAEVTVLIPGTYQGEVVISASIGVASDQTVISKELPTEEGEEGEEQV